MMLRVPARAAEADARHNLTVLSDEIDHTRFLERHEIVNQVTGPIAFVGMRGVVPFALPNQIASARKPGTHPSVDAFGEAPCMIEMQMRRDDEVNVGNGKVQ